MTHTSFRDSLSLDERLIRSSHSLLYRAFDALINLPHIKKSIIRRWYQYLNILDRGADFTFMNYGYAPLDSRESEIELLVEDRTNQYCIQLYNCVAGVVDLSSKDLLEVGCGRGGGASFIMRYLEPRSLTAIDFSSNAIEFCKSHYQLEGLCFFQEDSEDLPFLPNSFDAVINVESSHCYNSMTRFLKEVLRVLRPDGYLLFADIRSRKNIPLLYKQLTQVGFRVLEEERITANVLQALELDNERKLALIESIAPKLICRRVQQFAGLKGSPIYKRFLTGDWEYLRFVLQKRDLS